MGALVLALAGAGKARTLEDQVWIWHADGVTNSQLERMDGGVQNISLFAKATCSDASTVTAGAGVYDGGPIDSNGDFSFSGPDPDDPTAHIELQGHFGSDTLTGTYRLTGLDSYCYDHAPGDTGVVSFTATCYEGCPSGGGGGGGSSLAVPSGKWAVKYPAKFKCGKKKLCSAGFFDGPRAMRPLLKGMLAAQLDLTPSCAELTCAVDATVRTRSGKTFTVRIPKHPSSYGLHSVMTTRTSPVRCGRRHVKAKLIIGLTQYGAGASAKLQLKEALYLDAKSVHPRACMRTDLTANLGYRSTATTQVP